MFGFFKKHEQLEEKSSEDEENTEDAKLAVWVQQKCQVGLMFAKHLSDPDEDYDTQCLTSAPTGQI